MRGLKTVNILIDPQPERRLKGHGPRNLPSRMEHSEETAKMYYYERSAKEKKGIAAQAALMKDAQSRMPESFLYSATELTPELQKVRLEGEKNAQDAARASSDRLRKAKARANFTSRQKLTVDDGREKMVELLNNCGGEVRWSATLFGDKRS